MKKLHKYEFVAKILKLYSVYEKRPPKYSGVVGLIEIMGKHHRNFYK